MSITGFVGQAYSQGVDLPPGQHLARDFPGLSAGPTPLISTIASAAGGSGLVEITVDTTPDGEVSTYLTQDDRPDHHVQLRGPWASGSSGTPATSHRSS